MPVPDKRSDSRPGSLGCGLRACQRAAQNALVVCPACHDRLRRDLGELPELYQYCESLLVRFPPAFTQKPGDRRAAGLPLCEPVANARRDIVAVLASWSGLVADERGTTRPRRRDVRDLTAFLSGHIDWLLGHPAGLCFAEELVTVAADARRASGGPLVDVELGRCVAEGCDLPLTLARAGGGTSSSLEVHCAGGHVWQARQWLQLARQLSRTTSVPSQLAALAAGVSEATIRKWASRGKLSRYGTPGRAEYDLGELLELTTKKGS